MIVGSGDGSAYMGWIVTSGGLYSYSVEAKEEATVKPESLVMDSLLFSLMQRLETDQLAKRLSRCFAPAKLDSELHLLVNFALKKTSKAGILGGTLGKAMPECLLLDLQQVGWERLVHLAPDFSRITLRAVAPNQQEHLFDLTIPPDYPRSPPSVEAGLPHPVLLDSPTADKNPQMDTYVRNNLVNAFRQVEQQLRTYQEVFTSLAELDENAWVLEPAQASLATLQRRVLIEKTCSVIFEATLSHPRGPFDLTFLGPPKRVDELQATYMSNATQWSSERGIKANLETTLQLSLPSRVGVEGSDENGLAAECGICYSYILETEDDDQPQPVPVGSADIPDQICENSRCGKVYHSACLLDWLQSLPSSRKSFGTIFGNCPYCAEHISLNTMS
jgi:E3 ubiquitin-protein ligase FANCL